VIPDLIGSPRGASNRSRMQLQDSDYRQSNVQRQYWFLNQFLVGTSPLARRKRSARKSLNNVVVIALEKKPEITFSFCLSLLQSHTQNQ
jgi:hypothetical protein